MTSVTTNLVHPSLTNWSAVARPRPSGEYIEVYCTNASSSSSNKSNPDINKLMFDAYPFSARLIKISIWIQMAIAEVTCWA